MWHFLRFDKKSDLCENHKMTNKYRGTVSKREREREKQHTRTHIYTYKCTHKHTHIYVCVFVSVSTPCSQGLITEILILIKKHES